MVGGCLRAVVVVVALVGWLYVGSCEGMCLSPTTDVHTAVTQAMLTDSTICFEAGTYSGFGTAGLIPNEITASSFTFKGVLGTIFDGLSSDIFFQCGATDCTFINIVFVNGPPFDNGFRISDPSLTVFEGCVFQEFSGASVLSVISTPGVVLNSTTFNNIQSLESAVVVNSGDLLMENVTFNNVRSSNSGGAVFMNTLPGYRFEMRGCRFENVTSLMSGGAIFLSNAAVLVPTGYPPTTFVRCSASQAGSVMKVTGWSIGPNVEIHGVVVEDCRSEVGAFHVSLVSTVWLDGCTFLNSGATVASSLLISDVVTLNVTNCLFEGNTATDKHEWQFLSSAQVFALNNTISDAVLGNTNVPCVHINRMSESVTVASLTLVGSQGSIEIRDVPSVSITNINAYENAVDAAGMIVLESVTSATLSGEIKCNFIQSFAVSCDGPVFSGAMNDLEVCGNHGGEASLSCQCFTSSSDCYGTRTCGSGSCPDFSPSITSSSSSSSSLESSAATLAEIESSAASDVFLTCLARTTCKDCVEVDTCGWCTEEGTCSPVVMECGATKNGTRSGSRGGDGDDESRRPDTRCSGLSPEALIVIEIIGGSVSLTAVSAGGFMVVLRLLRGRNHERVVLQSQEELDSPGGGDPEKALLGAPTIVVDAVSRPSDTDSSVSVVVQISAGV